MSTAVLSPSFPRSRPALRPLALPTEHGGWGFLSEPIVLGLAVAPSQGGALVALAFLFAFLCRQPLRLGLQDALRGRAYPRTRWCWLFVAAYAACALASLAFAVFVAGWAIVIPIGLVAPMGLTQILYDASKRGRALLPELGGAAAMSSSAAAIAIAAGMRIVPALALSGIIVARAIPSIVYVRTLLTRSHGKQAASWPPLALHALAIVLVALFAKPLAVAAMVLLFVRAAWQLARPVPSAKKIGWMEVVVGTVVVALAILSF
jgi:hypothetical protein